MFSRAHSAARAVRLLNNVESAIRISPPLVSARFVG
jgi:hypothetical protein